MEIFKKNGFFYIEGAENISPEHGYIAVTEIGNDTVLVVKKKYIAETNKPVDMLPESVCLESSEKDNEFFLIHKELRAVSCVSALEKPCFYSSGLAFVHKENDENYGYSLYYTVNNNSEWILIPNLSADIRKISDKCVIVRHEFQQIMVEDGKDACFFPYGMDVDYYCEKAGQVSFCNKNFGHRGFQIGVCEISASGIIFRSEMNDTCRLSDICLVPCVMDNGVTVWYNSYAYWRDGVKHEISDVPVEYQEIQSRSVKCIKIPCVPDYLSEYYFVNFMTDELHGPYRYYKEHNNGNYYVKNVMTDGKAVFDKDFKLLISGTDIEYDSINHIYIVYNGKKYAFVHSDGEFIYSYIFDECIKLENGCYQVRAVDYTGILEISDSVSKAIIKLGNYKSIIYIPEKDVYRTEFYDKDDYCIFSADGNIIEE